MIGRGKKTNLNFYPPLFRIPPEVIVEFLEGDTVNVPPYKLPEHKTRMTIKSKTHKGTGFNELRFEDKKGEEEVRDRCTSEAREKKEIKCA